MSAAQRKAAKQRFLEALQTDPNISAACDHALISRQTAYTWRERDAAFSKAWDSAVERLNDTARSSIYRRGILGWEEPLVSAGQPVYEVEQVLDEQGNPKLDSRNRPVLKQGKMIMVRKYSDSLAALYAKANLREYKDKAQVNVNAQLSDLAEQAKRELLADLAAAPDDDEKPQ